MRAIGYSRGAKTRSIPATADRTPILQSKWRAIGLAGVLFILSQEPASGQVLDPTTAIPIIKALDDVGTDIRSGHPEGTATRLSIGAANAPAMSFGVYSMTFDGDTPLHSSASHSCTTYGGVPGCIYSVYHYSYGGDAEVYVQTPPSYATQAGRLAPGFTERGAKPGAGGLIKKDGTVWQYNTDNGGWITSVTKPDGEVLSYNYVSMSVDPAVYLTSSITYLTSVVSSRGYMLHLEGAVRSPGGALMPSRAVLINLNVDYCDPLAIGPCTNLTQNWPSITFTETSSTAPDGTGTDVSLGTDNLGRAWKFVSTAQYNATTNTGYAQHHFETPMGVWHEYYLDVTGPIQIPGTIDCSIAFVSGGPCTGPLYYPAYENLRWFRNAAGQWNYSKDGNGATISTAPDGVTEKWAGGAGGSFIDGLGRATAYNLMGFTDPIPPDPTIPGHVSGIDSLTVTLTSITYPEGNNVSYTFDDRYNVTQVTETNKAGDTTISASASYPTYDTCSTTPKICNKPFYTIDPKGNRTDYTYDPQSGGVLTKTLPADQHGNRAQTRSTYVQLSAKSKNASGSLVSNTPIWVLQSTSICKTMTLATCVGTDDEVITSYTYNDNLLPVTVTQASGTGTVYSMVTTAYDAVGNVVSVTGPAPGGVDTKYYFYDAGRQKIGEIDPSPDGTKPRPATRTTYNLDGQPVKVETGTATGTALADLNAMTVCKRSDMTYDAMGRLSQTTETALSCN